MLRLTNNRKKVEISLGLIMPEPALENALSNNPTKENLRWARILSNYVSKIEMVKADLIYDKNVSIDVKELKILMMRELGLFNYWEEEEKQKQKNLFIPFFLKVGESKAKSTYESFKYTISVMRKFDSKADELTFEGLNYTWLSDLEIWCRKRGLSQNTRKIHFGNIRIAMREAYKRELTNNDPFRRFSFRPEKTRKRSLSVEDLRKLFNYPVEDYAVFYRDMFMLIFMLCGINSVDLYNLKNISANGRIEYKRAKTGRLYSFKVEPEMEVIINKYRGKSNLLIAADRWNDHRNFRHQLNKALQNIGVSQGKGKKRLEGVAIWPELTSYWARHTWATIAADLDIPDAVISMALGHSGENRVTDIYIRRNQKKVDEANRKVLDWVLYDKR